MTSSSSSLCRRHSDLHSPVSYTPSPLSAFLQSSTDYRSTRTQHNYQTTDYLPPVRVTSASGLHGDAMTLQQQQQRSPSFAIHELLGLHGSMLGGTAAGTCHGAAMFDCSAAGGYAAVTGGVGASNYRQQFFPAVATYNSSAGAPPPSTPLDLEPPPPPPLLPGPPSCHRASSSSWPPSTSPTSHVPQLTTAHAHRPTTYRDAYDVLQRNFRHSDVTRTFAPAAAAAAARSVVGHHKYSTHYRTSFVSIYS